MNKVAYIAGFIKQAAKIDQLLRMGKLSPEAWNRYLDFTRTGLTHMDEKIPGLRDLALSHTGDISKQVHDSRYTKGYYGYIDPTLRTGGLSQPNFSLLVKKRVQGPGTGLPRPKLTWLAKPSTDKSPLDNLMDKYTWGTNKNDWDAYYSPATNNINGSPIGSMTLRHELGHWADASLADKDPDKHDVLLRTILGRLRTTDSERFKNLGASDRKELLGHYLAARKGFGGTKLRTATKDSWISPWADAIRKKYPNDPAAASVVEHLQRNYGIGGGLLRDQLAALGNKVPDFMLAENRPSPYARYIRSTESLVGKSLPTPSRFSGLLQSFKSKLFGTNT